MSTTEPDLRAPAQDSDEAVLESFGYKQELRRTLSFWTNFAVGFAFISPVVGLYAIIALATFAAGPAWVWALPIVLIGQLLVASVFAELASQFPIAGGIYQWSRRLVGPTYAWFAGWAYVWTVMLTVTAISYFGAIWLASVFDATPSPNAQVLWAFGILAAATFVNSIGLNPLKYVVNAGIIAECVASVLIGTLLLLFFRNHPISFLWEGLGSSANFGGNYFAGFIAAIAISGWAFVGFDSCGSVSEETRDPMTRVPRAILYSLSSVALVIILNAVAIGLSFKDTSKVVSLEVLDPVTPAVTDAFGSWVEKPFELVVLTAFVACAIAVQATAVRVLFSLSRDRMLPGSSVLRKVGSNKVPKGAVAFAAIVSGCGLVFGLDTRAVNTLITFGSGGFYITFWLVCAGALWARLTGRWVPAGRFSLGRFALPVNIAAVVWLTFEAINIAWPRSVLAPPGAPFWQVWAIVLLSVVLGVIGTVYVLVARPQDRVRTSAAMGDLGEAAPLPSSGWTSGS
jgi:amino acid transporter